MEVAVQPALEPELALERLGPLRRRRVDLRVPQLVDEDPDRRRQPEQADREQLDRGRGFPKSPTEMAAIVGTNAISLKRMSVSMRSSCVVWS